MNLGDKIIATEASTDGQIVKGKTYYVLGVCGSVGKGVEFLTTDGRNYHPARIFRTAERTEDTDEPVRDTLPRMRGEGLYLFALLWALFGVALLAGGVALVIYEYTEAGLLVLGLSGAWAMATRSLVERDVL